MLGCQRLIRRDPGTEEGTASRGNDVCKGGAVSEPYLLSHTDTAIKESRTLRGRRPCPCDCQHTPPLKQFCIHVLRSVPGTLEALQKYLDLVCFAQSSVFHMRLLLHLLLFPF